MYRPTNHDFPPFDYHPFGMLLTGRSWEAGNDYRYGFNAQEQDDEVYGNGNLNTALFWEYDSRLGRRWNIDPKPFGWLSGYATFRNNPVYINDKKGDIITIANSITGESVIWNPGAEYKGSDPFIIATFNSLNLLSSTAGVGDIDFVDDTGAKISGNVLTDFTAGGKYVSANLFIMDATASGDNFDTHSKTQLSADSNPTIYFNSNEGLQVLPGIDQAGGNQAPFMLLLSQIGYKWVEQTAPNKANDLRKGAYKGKGSQPGDFGTGLDYLVLDKIEAPAARIFTSVGNTQAERTWFRQRAWRDEERHEIEGTFDIMYLTSSSTSTRATKSIK